MKFQEIVSMAFSSLGANKLRSALTLVGMSIGVFSIIFVMTLINAMRSSVESGLNVLGANSFQIQKWPAINFSREAWARFRNRKDITYATASRFK